MAISADFRIQLSPGYFRDPAVTLESPAHFPQQIVLNKPSELPPFHQAAAEGNLSGITMLMNIPSLTPEQRARAVNIALTDPPYAGLTPLLAVLKSGVFLSALHNHDTETLNRFAGIVLLLIQVGADIKTVPPDYEDTLLYFLTIWASIPGQKSMLSLLRSLRDLLLAEGPHAPRHFTAQDRLEILSARQKFASEDLTPLGFIFKYRTSYEVAEVLMEIGKGLSVHDLDALLLIALDRLKTLCLNHDSLTDGTDPTAAYFSIDPELVGSLLNYISLCIDHGASPAPFLNSFVCADRESTMSLIAPLALDLSQEEIAAEPIFQSYHAQYLASLEALQRCLGLIYEHADEALTSFKRHSPAGRASQ